MKLKVTEIIVTLAVMSSVGHALQCYNCEEMKVDGEVLSHFSNACEGSQKTCYEDVNTCMISRYTFKLDSLSLEKKVEGEYKAIQCSEGKEEEQCEYLKRKLVEAIHEDNDTEDFKCNVRSCDTDLCTIGTSDSEKTAQDNFLVLACLIVLQVTFC